MSAFTTPSRDCTNGAAAPQRGGGSSSRRVVRSALETLMDTATPELPGRGGGSVSCNSGSNTKAYSDARKRSSRAAGAIAAMRAPSTSPFSVTYTAGPPGQFAGRGGSRLPTSTSAVVPKAAAPAASTSGAASSSTGAHGGGAEEKSIRSMTQVRHEEPSALAFLSPQSKAARPAVSASTSSTSLLLQSSYDGPSQRPRQRVAAAFDNDDDFDDGSTHVAKETHGLLESEVLNQGRNQRRKTVRSLDAHNLSSSQLVAAPAPAVVAAPVSPSRSLYYDVEEARQQQLSRSLTSDFDDPSSSPAAADTSFVSDNEKEVLQVEDEGEEQEDEEADFVEVVARPSRTSDDRSLVEKRKGEGTIDTKIRPAAEVEALIAAALRRYEKARDAEEEAVLQQVSKEVEAQATRYAALVEAYNNVSSDNAQLQEELTTSIQKCGELEQAVQSAQQMQQAQQESMKRLEVELYHARDAQQQAQEQQRAQLKDESAEWAATKRRYEKRHATLEAQLIQLREEVQEKDAHIEDLTRQLTGQKREMADLQQRSAQRATALEDEYAEIHQRMLRLGHNMSSMETTLRERDETIRALREQLAEATASLSVQRNYDHELRQWEEERAKMTAELANTRELLQKQTDGVRKRMHRFTSLEQQKNVLKSEVAEARQALSTASENQARLLKSLEDMRKEMKRLTLDAQPHHIREHSTVDFPSVESARPVSLNGGTESADDEAAFFRKGVFGLDETLVYEDDSDGSIALASDCSSVSKEETVASMMKSEGSGEEEEADSENEVLKETSEDERENANLSTVKGKSSRLPASLPKGASKQRRTTSPQQRFKAPVTAEASITSAEKLDNAGESSGGHHKTVSASAVGSGAITAKDNPSVKRLAQLLHHDVARAQIVVRELRRQLATIVKQSKQQRKLSLEASGSQSRTSSTGSVGAAKSSTATASKSAAPWHRTTFSTPSSAVESSTHTTERTHDVVRKLEQACRYLKSELTAAKTALGEAQAECQWRSLSMKKWEGDVQAARREVLNLEKERLTYTTERETLELVKQELEDQLLESQKACAAATEKCEAAQSTLEELKAVQKSTQQELEQLTEAKTAAEAALEKEHAKTNRLTTKVAELTEAQTALTDEMTVLQDKHKATLSQLQVFRAQEATQRLRDQQESQLHTGELAELRSAVAQLRVAESAWEAERTGLQSTVSALHHNVEVLTEVADTSGRRCAALETDVTLQVDLEMTTLLTIANIVQAPPMASDIIKDLLSGGLDASPTEKKLFDVDEPSVEEVVVEENDMVAASVRAKPRQQQQRLTRTPTRKLSSIGNKKRSPSSTVHRSTVAYKASTSTLSSGSSPRLQEQASATAAALSAHQLAQLRQHVVAAVQRVALELTRLRAAAEPGPTLTSPPFLSKQTGQQHQQEPAAQFTTLARTAEKEGQCNDDDATSAGTWFGAETTRNTSPSQPLFKGREAPLSDHRSPLSGPFTSPCTTSITTVTHTPLHLQRAQSSSNSRLRTEDRVAATTTSATTTSTPDPINQRVRSPTSSSPPLQQRHQHQPLQVFNLSSASPQYSHALSASVVHSPATEHVYNVSPWAPSRGLWSPSAVPPTAEVPSTKMWSEVRRSSSMEDGLSGYSHSATRGDVDGSGSPARPPSLRAHSLLR